MKNGLLILFWLLFSPAPFAATIKSVVTLSPHTTEIAYAAGLGNKIIAVSEHSDYPPQAKVLQKVANYQGINVEKILALKPGLVISWPDGNPPRELRKLEQMGLQIYPSHIKTIQDIAADIESLSQYADHPETGQKNAQYMRQTVAYFKKKYQHSRKIRYFYQLSEKPVITIAQDSWPSEVFDLCGGENVFADSAIPYPQVSLENILIAKPEAIFSTDDQPSVSASWTQWPQIPAVRHHHIKSLHGDWINRPTFRTLKAIKEVCQYFDTIRQND